MLKTLFHSLLLIILIILLLIAANLFFHKAKAPIASNASISQIQVVQKDVVFNKLVECYQIVGLESTFQKNYAYQDSNFFGSRKYEIELNGRFKMGFNLNDFKEYMMSINNGIVTITVPKPVLISFEVPFDEIKITKDKALLRKDFTEEDRQLIYKVAKDKALSEIVSNTNIENEARLKTKNAIKKMLLTIPGIKDIQFNN